MFGGSGRAGETCSCPQDIMQSFKGVAEPHVLLMDRRRFVATVSRIPRRWQEQTNSEIRTNPIDQQTTVVSKSGSSSYIHILQVYNNTQ